MVSFLIRILGNALALYLAFLLVPGFVITGTGTPLIEHYALAGLVLALLNMIVKPVLKLLASPLILLTFGLFTIVINALMLWAVDYSFDFINIESLTALVWATILISVVNLIVSVFAKIV